MGKGRKRAKCAILSIGSPNHDIPKSMLLLKFQKQHKPKPAKYASRTILEMTETLFSIISKTKYRYPALQRLHIIQLLVIAVKAYKMFVRAAFHDSTLVKHANLISILYR